MQQRAIRDKALTYLALCGVAAPIIFAVLVTVGGTIYEGYSHATQAVSELGGVGAPYPLLQNANFFVLGVLVVAFALGLHRGMGDGKGPWLGPVLIATFGVSSGLANAFLPCDAGCEFETATGALHNLTGLAGFLAAIIGIFAILRRLEGDSFWRSYRSYSLITAVAALVALLAWLGVTKAAGVGSLNGVLQRVFIGIWLLWIEVMAVRLLRLSLRERA